MKILFLDFDGVLHPTGANTVKFTRLPVLETFLSEPAARSIQVVITSTWRDAYSIGTLRGFFSEGIRPRILGCTEPLDEYLSEYQREEEIKGWINGYPSAIERWVVLDDDRLHFSPAFHKHVIFTDSSVGLDGGSIEAVRRVLV